MTVLHDPGPQTSKDKGVGDLLKAFFKTPEGLGAAAGFLVVPFVAWVAAAEVYDGFFGYYFQSYSYNYLLSPIGAAMGWVSVRLFISLRGTQK